jgi:hypothetical protein
MEPQELLVPTPTVVATVAVPPVTTKPKLNEGVPSLLRGILMLVALKVPPFTRIKPFVELFVLTAVNVAEPSLTIRLPPFPFTVVTSFAV